MSELPSLPEAPDVYAPGDDAQLGIYRTPFAEIDLGGRGLSRYRLKEWHYLSFTNDRFFVALGLVQLGYVGSVFAYAVDRAGDAPTHEYGVISPLGRQPSIAESSVRGTTAWKTREAAVSITARDGWDVALDLPVGALRLTGEAHIEAQESLAMLHRLDATHVAYTHKAAGWPASGALRLGDVPISLEGALAASDWTRSQARRETVWNWCCTSGRLADGRAFGLNLSAQVYDDERGHSRENAAWIDGRVVPLGGVRFDVPPRPKDEPWRVRSLEGDEVDLEIHPEGAREEHMGVGPLRTDFVQPYGRFEGNVLGHDVSGLFGVVEDHHALW